MQKEIAIQASPRTQTGKRSTKSVRRDDMVPAVMYGGDEVFHFSVSEAALKPLVYTSEFRVAEISLDGNTHRAIVKDLQFHPVTEKILHVDFLRFVQDQPIKLEVPVRFKGSSPGVKVGGKLQQNLRRVKIKVRPKDLVYAVTVDVSHLELGQSVRVRDIEPQDGVEVLNQPATPVASIEIPRALRSAATAAKKEGAAGAAAPAE